MLQDLLEEGQHNSLLLFLCLPEFLQRLFQALLVLIQLGLQYGGNVFPIFLEGLVNEKELPGLLDGCLYLGVTRQGICTLEYKFDHIRNEAASWVRIYGHIQFSSINHIINNG